MILSLHPCFTADYQIIIGSREPDESDLLMIEQASLIILPQSCSENLFNICSESKAVLFPDYTPRFKYQGKSGQSIMFNENGLPQPDTKVWESISSFREALAGEIPHELPFLLKEDMSHEAKGIHLIKDKQDIDISLGILADKFRKESHRFISQEFIQGKGNILRVVIMGDSFISYWKRPVRNDQQITTLSNGAKVDKEWKPDLQEKGIEMARKLSKKTGINLAAVDFIFNLNQTDPEPLFLEVNYYFGRRGLGGSIKYYTLLYETITCWMEKNGFDSSIVNLE